MNFFSIFFIENELFTENAKKLVHCVTSRTVERFNLHSWYLYQTKRNFVLYKTIESFFFEFHFSFRVIPFL